jgi:hypothetical protein
MMRTFFILILFLLFVSCGGTRNANHTNEHHSVKNRSNKNVINSCGNEQHVAKHKKKPSMKLFGKKNSNQWRPKN